MGNKRGAKPIPIYGKLPANKRPISRTLLHFYLQQHAISRSAFARKMGCNPNMVDYWCDGRCVPSLLYAFMIEKVTEGGVPAAAWLGTDVGRMQWARAQERISG